MGSKGYAGRILYVDLTNGATRTEELDTTLAKDFIGGWGLNAKLAYDHTTPRLDPYDPLMPIIIGAGVLVGTLAPCAPKTVVTTKCPSAGTVSTAVGGMDFGAALKWAGYDHVIITGKADKPAYLKIVDDDVKICDADDLWGKDMADATNILRERHGGTSSIACIGPAGERMLKLAIVLINKVGTIGRTLGGNMGSKNLKAIVVDGTKGLEVADSKKFMALSDSLNAKFMQDPLREKWTNLNLFFIQPVWAAAGHISAKNQREIISEETTQDLVKRFGAEQFLKIRTRSLSCASCGSADKAVVEVKEGPFAGCITALSTPLELGFCHGLGFPDISWAAEYCDRFNRMGLDFMTYHSVLDWAVDLFENGVINKEDTGGIELKSGMGFEALEDLLALTVNQEGFGQVLGCGYIEAIQRLGKDSAKYAIHIKGTEPDFDIRASFGVEAFGQVTNPRGGHDMPVGGMTVAVGRKPEFFQKIAVKQGVPPEAMERIFVPPGFDIGRLQVHYENWAEVLNSLGICFRMQCSSLYSIETCAQLFTAATGINITPEELIRSADRAFNIYKALNAREGFTRKDDRFPERWVREPLEKGDTLVPATDYFKSKAFTPQDFEKTLDNYYDERGWDLKSGIPTRRKLEQLGMKDVADDLQEMGIPDESPL
ncbi:MAG: aldehyde ferredoxin oxidoreductase N-terminal domain-containing protein [Thermodesulfobacteriota bacterium]|nr:aldehyde ferredoxin oxidoreductase N-terminal domain-containing protein [Thermodesulfobacteriota bacterium]